MCFTAQNKNNNKNPQKNPKQNKQTKTKNIKNQTKTNKKESAVVVFWRRQKLLAFFLPQQRISGFIQNRFYLMYFKFFSQILIWFLDEPCEQFKTRQLPFPRTTWAIIYPAVLLPQNIPDTRAILVFFHHCPEGFEFRCSPPAFAPKSPRQNLFPKCKQSHGDPSFSPRVKL